MYTFSIHPIVLIAIVSTLACLVAVGMALYYPHRPTRIVCGFLAIFLTLPVLYVYFWDWADPRIRTYKRFYQEVHEGMTREEVLAVLDRRYPANGPRARPRVTIDSGQYLSFLMNPESSSEPNAEGISLKLRDNRVVAKDYMPD